jgi:putative flippase GtrA
VDYSFHRFLLVGLINTCIGLSVIYVLVNSLEFSYWVSTFSGNFIGACISYSLNKSFTFRSEKSISNTILRFFVVIALCYFFSYFLGMHLALWMIEQLPHTHLTYYTEEVSILLGTAFYTISNYFAQKQFVFSK